MYKFTIFLTLSVMVLGIGLIAALQTISQQKAEAHRLSVNQEGLLARLHTYQLRDSLNAASVTVLTLKNGELKTQCRELDALVKDMGIKLKRVETVAQNSVVTRVNIAAPVRDTLVLRDTVWIPAAKISYRDPHIAFEGVAAGGEFSGEFTSVDTLTQVVHRVPKKFWFIRCGTRCLQQEIVSSNPHSRIVYSRYINVVK